MVTDEIAPAARFQLGSLGNPPRNAVLGFSGERTWTPNLTRGGFAQANMLPSAFVRL
jgi:hypothetical protein